MCGFNPKFLNDLPVSNGKAKEVFISKEEYLREARKALAANDKKLQLINVKLGYGLFKPVPTLSDEQILSNYNPEKISLSRHWFNRVI